MSLVPNSLLNSLKNGELSLTDPSTDRHGQSSCQELQSQEIEYLGKDSENNGTIHVDTYKYSKNNQFFETSNLVDNHRQINEAKDSTCVLLLKIKDNSITKMGYHVIKKL